MSENREKVSFLTILGSDTANSEIAEEIGCARLLASWDGARNGSKTVVFCENGQKHTSFTLNLDQKSVKNHPFCTHFGTQIGRQTQCMITSPWGGSNGPCLDL